MLRLSWSRNSYSGHSRILLVARTMALSASTWYSWSGSTRLTPHMLIRRFKRTMSFMARSCQVVKREIIGPDARIEWQGPRLLLTLAGQRERSCHGKEKSGAPPHPDPPCGNYHVLVLRRLA